MLVGSHPQPPDLLVLSARKTGRVKFISECRRKPRWSVLETWSAGALNAAHTWRGLRERDVRPSNHPQRVRAGHTKSEARDSDNIHIYLQRYLLMPNCPTDPARLSPRARRTRRHRCRVLCTSRYLRAIEIAGRQQTRCRCRCRCRCVPPLEWQVVIQPDPCPPECQTRNTQ